jgi:excisionase family DNA binding protein
MSLIGTYKEKEHLIVQRTGSSYNLYRVPDRYIELLKDGQQIEFASESRDSVLWAVSIKPYIKSQNPKLLTIGEVSKLLHVHTNTLRRWADYGIIKAYRIGPRGDRRFKLEDIQNLLAISQTKSNENYIR